MHGEWQEVTHQVWKLKNAEGTVIAEVHRAAGYAKAWIYSVGPYFIGICDSLECAIESAEERLFPSAAKTPDTS